MDSHFRKAKMTRFRMKTKENKSGKIDDTTAYKSKKCNHEIKTVVEFINLFIMEGFFIMNNYFKGKTGMTSSERQMF